MKLRYCHFTLVELVVALAIIAIGSTFAVAAFRGESPAQSLNRLSLEFEAFCARARYRCAEEGRRWVIRYQPEERRFSAQTDRTEEEIEALEYENTVLPPPLTFALPQEVQCLLTDDPLADMGGEPEDAEESVIFYLYPDGGAAARTPLSFRREKLARVVQISPLTSRLVIAEPEEKQP